MWALNLEIRIFWKKEFTFTNLGEAVFQNYIWNSFNYSINPFFPNLKTRTCEWFLNQKYVQYLESSGSEFILPIKPVL